METQHSSSKFDKLAYGVVEAARVAGIGRSTVYEALASGELKAVKLGRRTLIPVDELRRFLAALPPARSASTNTVQGCDCEPRSRRSAAA